jgi:hypothetical protein
MTTLLFTYYPKSCAQEIKAVASVTLGESGINVVVIVTANPVGQHVPPVHFKARIMSGASIISVGHAKQHAGQMRISVLAT